jgi:hypothetical protein
VRPAFRAVQAIFVGLGWIDYVAIGRPDQVTVQGDCSSRHDRNG